MKPRSTGDILQDIAKQLELEMDNYRGIMKGWFVSREWNAHTNEVTVVNRPTVTDAHLTRVQLSPEDWDVLYEHLSYELSVDCPTCGHRLGTKQMAPDGRTMRYLRNPLTMCQCLEKEDSDAPKTGRLADLNRMRGLRDEMLALTEEVNEALADDD